LSGSDQKLRVLFTCGREPSYPRNQLIQHSLIDACDTISLTSSQRAYPGRLTRLYPRYLSLPFQQLDAAWVGFLGQPLVPAVRAVVRAPLIFDAFISLYDTLCFDRKVYRPNSPLGRLIFALDRLSCNLSSIVVVDTQAHARYFQETFGLEESRLKVLFVGCDERVFSPLAIQEDPDLVLFYGSFLPLHGIQTIIQAAHLLGQNSSIRFRIIGEGLQSAYIRGLSAEMGLKNVEFHPSVPFKDLPAEIARAAVCLGGHFSDIPKAGRVIAGKTFQCLAMGKATIVGDNSANAELLTHAESAWFCKMNDPQALADAIRGLIADRALRSRIGQVGRQVFLDQASFAVLSQQVHAITNEAVRMG
jgi:glycosyltransferase involved in cell wall biosynthesis